MSDPENHEKAKGKSTRGTPAFRVIQKEGNHVKNLIKPLNINHLTEPSSVDTKEAKHRSISPAPEQMAAQGDTGHATQGHDRQLWKGSISRGA